MPKKVVSKWARDTRETMVAFLVVKVTEESQRLGLSYSETQKKIGHAAGGLSLSTMQRIMSGDTGPSIDTLSDLAHTLGCTVAQMLTGGETSPHRVGTVASKMIPETIRVQRR